MTTKTSLLIALGCLPLFLIAQKKPLDHSVYDAWQNIGERKISPNGQWAVYTVDVQEGDGQLMVQPTSGGTARNFPRGYSASISNDSRFVVFRLKAPYADTRQAKIKKKKPDEMPKDSLAVLDLVSGKLYVQGRVKAYRMPEKGEAWLAMHLEKALTDSSKKQADTTRKAMDSVKVPIHPVVEQKPDKKRKQKQTVKEDDGLEAANGRFEADADQPEANADLMDAEGDDPAAGVPVEGTDLLIRNLSTGEEYRYPLVSDFSWSRNGKILLVEGTSAKANPKSKNSLSVFRSLEGRADTISTGAGDYRNFAIDEESAQVAFVAERDSSAKSLQKFYKVWYWKNGWDTARLAVDRSMAGMSQNWTVSENASLQFSKNGERLFFGTAPVRAPKDTNLVEMDLVKLDLWHYNDDYLQPQQLRNLDLELKRSYLAVYHVAERRMVQLADRQVPTVSTGDEGNGPMAVGITDMGKRVEAQWEGRTRKDIYAIDVYSGKRTVVTSNLAGNASISPAGKYIWWYDQKERQYRSWQDGKIHRISDGAKTSWHDEEFDMPDYPSPYGPMRWTEGDQALLVYDRFDIWQLDPAAARVPANLTQGLGRKNRTSYRYLQTDPEERFLKPGQDLLLRAFNERSKTSGYAQWKADICCAPSLMQMGDYQVGPVVKARDAQMYLFTRETYTQSPNLFASTDLKSGTQLSSTNPQQASYNWGRAELFTWKAYNGKEATGIVYLPEDFDPGKKYPMIAYFYERLSDGLHNYMAPAPTPSRLNIPFFVSRGYIVLAPDIEYTTGYPGKAAFDYVVSGARALVRKGWVDSTRMGIQGQSWGGYQVAHIITRTRLFKAAWAGAPVANMTSAYGGIRWESGLNRQFQYEHSQSRIGATLWEKPNLYIENSPLFHLKNVSTPLVIMANDADGAVPWYQGIEMFTAMRRLGKQVWMLNYNGEAHNLVERKNRKDIQVREQQYFDWLLKGEKPAPWITDGIPATEKGRYWGLE